MRIKQPEFLELLSTFVKEYMPFTAGLSNNPVRLYKATLRLLLTFMFEANGASAEKLTFHMLDYTTILAFLKRKPLVIPECSLPETKSLFYSDFLIRLQRLESGMLRCFLSCTPVEPAPKKSVISEYAMLCLTETIPLLQLPVRAIKPGESALPSLVRRC